MITGVPAQACLYAASTPKCRGLSEQLCWTSALEQVSSSKALGETLKLPVGYSKCKVCRHGNQEPQKEIDV